MLYMYYNPEQESIEYKGAVHFCFSMMTKKIVSIGTGHEKKKIHEKFTIPCHAFQRWKTK